MGSEGNPHPRPVTVIVPVYRDIALTRDCLESVVSSDLPGDTSVVIIDDNSPEDTVSEYCQQLSQRADIRLEVNAENLGFVGTANKGFALAPEADVILLNSDTTVSGDWVQRLRQCAYRDDDTGTVTPFSNNGTICSYPVPLCSNEIPARWTATELDRVFKQANAGQHCGIPTAVGFCMYIKRSCLNATGPFDEASFGHGYGEECDFSLRASAVGWKHVIAADVFVYHAGAASFASESTDRKRSADAILNKLHPQYHELVTDFIDRDPLYAFRSTVDAIRLHEKPDDTASILQEHLRFTRSILDSSTLTRTSLRKEQEQRQSLEAMLTETRRQFAETDSALAEAKTLLSTTQQRFTETDRALAEAQAVVIQQNDDITRLNEDITRLSGDIAQLSQDLTQSQADNLALREKVSAMEQSRSWRYTAWLRKK